MSEQPFLNRRAELAALELAWGRRRGGQMLLLYGRRRLGKTFLLQHFFSDKPHCYYLAGQTTAATQRSELAREVLAALPDPGVSTEDLAVSWNSILRHITSAVTARSSTSTERFALILDEFQYLVKESPELPSVLQSWWDREGIRSRLFVALCGSQLSVMESLGVATAPLFGRFDAGIIQLGPLRYGDAACFYDGPKRYGRLEKLMMYGVFGGTPRYHAMVDVSRPMREAVADLLFRAHSPLENEVQFLIGSEAIRDPAPYNAVLRAIAGGATQFGEILTQSGTERGQLSFYLPTLQQLAWISREMPFKETAERRSIYRMADPFLRFWYRFIAPLASRRQFSDPERLYAEGVEPYLSDFMGLYVFEEICLQWLQEHAYDRLGVTILRAGRWWSRDGRTEIDIVAERDDGTHLFAECKWSHRSPVGARAYSELMAKVASLPDASWRDCASYVLFSAGGFRADVEAIAADPANRLALVRLEDLLPE